MLRLRKVSKDRGRRYDLENLETRELLTAMLQVTQIGDTPTAFVGNVVTFNLQVSNTSTAGETLTNVQVLDQLPADFRFVPEASTPGLTLNSGIVSGPLIPTLAAGASAPPISVAGVFLPGPASPGPYAVSNYIAPGVGPGAVTVFSPSGAIFTDVRPAVDLALTTSSAPPAVNPGQPASYTLTVSNASGFSDATHVVVTDTVPAGTTFDAAASSPGLTLSADGSTVVDLIGGLASGASQQITLVFIPDVSVQSSLLFNTATVTGLENDFDVGNNTSHNTSVSVNPTVNVSIVKAVSTAVPGLIGPNQDLTYTLTVSNTGPATATNVVVTDNLPAGVLGGGESFVNSDGGTLTGNGSQVIVTYPTLTAGSTRTIVITTRTSGPFIRNTNLVNTATVRPNEFNLSTQTAANASTLLDVVAPTVVNVVRYGYHYVPTVIVVHFSKPLNPATVNGSNFAILDYGNVPRRFWWLNPSRVPIAKVVYDAAHNSAYIDPSPLLPLTHTYAVIVAGVTDLVGNRLPTVSSTFINRSSVRGLFPPPFAVVNPVAIKNGLPARAVLKR